MGRKIFFVRPEHGGVGMNNSFSNILYMGDVVMCEMR